MSNLYNRQRNMNINRDQSICVVGCGGVGMNVAIKLAMAGVNKICLFDDDNIEEHNLNRLPVPYKSIGMNKAYVAKEMIKQMRPNCDVSYFKTKFDEMLLDYNIDWLIDCTDSFKTQKVLQEFADENSIKYCKLGYDGERMSIHNKVATWDIDENDQEGYTITPSWAVPASIISDLGVAKVLKYNEAEMSGELRSLYIR